MDLWQKNTQNDNNQQSPLYLPKSVGILSSDKNNQKSFVIETLGNKVIDSEYFFNSLQNPQAFINSLIKQKIN